jgi:cytochrome c oxidase cbb3-type subunit IV
MNFESVSIFAQTWGLLYLFILFLIVLVYALRPSARQKFEDAAKIPFKEN